MPSERSITPIPSRTCSFKRPDPGLRLIKGHHSWSKLGLQHTLRCLYEIAQQRTGIPWVNDVLDIEWFLYPFTRQAVKRLHLRPGAAL